MGRLSGMRARFRAGNDSGFTLVEAVVSLFVLGIIFTALATAAMGSIRASMNSRAEQQAIDFATQALEKARQAEYYGLAHDSADVVADSDVDPCGTTWCFDADGPGGSATEELAIQPGGSVNPHIETITSDVNNGTNFSVATYVTTPLSSGADVKRVTVVTRWNIAGKQRERASSSIVTATTRGLPIPLFTFKTASNTQAVNPGTGVAPHPVVAFKIEMTNQGAPDRWDLSTDGGTWTFWRDNGDNVLCMDAAECASGVAADSQLVDTDDVGAIVDTGRLDPTTSITFWAVRQVPEIIVGTYSTDLTATAVSLDHSGGEVGVGAKTLTLSTVVTTQPVTGQPGGSTESTAVPTAPRSLNLTVGDGKLTATWLAPDSVGTSAVSQYQVDYRVAGTLTWSTESNPTADLSRVISGLGNNTTYDIRVAARNAAGLGAFSSVATGTPDPGAGYLAPSICPTTNPASLPVPARSGGFTLWNYALHNRSSANGSWPGTSTPPPSRTDTQGVPLNMIRDLPQFGVGTTLPVYSADISTDRGRVIQPGGAINSPASSTGYFVDWRADTRGNRYGGTAVLTIWVAPATGSSSPAYSLSAQLYRSTATDTTMDNANLQGLTSAGNSPSSPVTITSAWCGGASWQQVGIALPIDTKRALATDESLGIRLWNTGAGSVRIGYDVAGDFPAYLTLPEK